MEVTSPTRLNEVERLAGLMFSAFEVGLITGVVPATEGDEFEKAMLRGRLKEEVVVRESVFALAKSGNSPAQTLAVELINQAHATAAAA